MEYNTSRTKMIISEYGRNVQKMIEDAIKIEDKETRNKQAKAIIGVMGQLNPQLREYNDFKHKLWDHLFIISDFKLDVDSPYPIPIANSTHNRPQRVPYPSKNSHFRHYGINIQQFIKKAQSLDKSIEKDALVRQIGYQLKRSYLLWNRDSVTDEIIATDLKTLSNDELQLQDAIRYANTAPVNQNYQHNPHQHKNFKKKKFNNNKPQQYKNYPNTNNYKNKEQHVNK